MEFLNEELIQQKLLFKKNDIQKKSALTIQGYQVPRSLLLNDELESIKKELTFEPIIAKSMKGLSKAIPVQVVKTTEKYIYLPKHYGIERFGIPPIKRILYQDNPINVKFTKALRPIQFEAKQAFFKLVNNNKKTGQGIGGIITLPTGFGKTVLSVNLICNLNTKTLIVAHKDFLLDQWYESLLKFSDIKKDDIGYIKGPKCEIENKKVILGSLQSISMKEYSSKTFLDIGFVIYDECHHIGSEVFHLAMPKLSTKYVLGLSATPNRKDGLEKVFQSFMGDIIFQTQLEKDSNVKVGIFVFRPTDKSYYKQEKITEQHFNLSKMVNKIASNQERNRFILNIILKIHEEEPERKFLVLSERKAQLQYLDTSLKSHNISCGLYYSGIPKKTLTENLQKNILLATMQMVSEGFDQPHLNTLVLCSPKVQITQIVGRILRTPKDQRTVMPFVIDIFDSVAPFTYYNNSRYSISANEKMDLKVQDEPDKQKQSQPPPMEEIDCEEDELLFNMNAKMKL